MTTFELWSLIISGATAAATIGAVIIALWLALPNWNKFTIKHIRVSLIHKADKSQKSTMLIMVENRQNVQMEIQNIELLFHYTPDNHSSHVAWNFNNEFIPPLSQYEVETPLTQNWAHDSLRQANKISVNVKTSLGNETIDFPKKYKSSLFRSMEFSKIINA